MFRHARAFPLRAVVARLGRTSVWVAPEVRGRAHVLRSCVVGCAVEYVFPISSKVLNVYSIKF